MDRIRVPFPAPGEQMLVVLREADTCFGHYAASAPECAECTAPIVVDERVHLCRDLCKAHKEKTAPGAALAWQPSSADVRQALVQGQTVKDMLERMTGGDPDLLRTARQLLGRRLSYLRRKDFPAPTLG